VRVIRRRNGGISAARNTGIQNASAEWVALLDVDDCWAPDKLERQIACIRSGTVLVYAGIRLFDDNGIRGERHAVDPASAKKMLRYCNPISPSTVLLRREAIMQIGGFNEDVSGCEDWDMWVRIGRLGQFESITDALTSYYVHPGSLSSNPEKMLQTLNQIINTTLLADRHGFSRWSWRRRILAEQLCSAGLIARDNGLKSELLYMFRSLCAWPSPLWQPLRFAIFAVSARNYLRSRG
jgi:glycosyltransferase involved in cell wall biosynthesis